MYIMIVIHILLLLLNIQMHAEINSVADKKIAPHDCSLILVHLGPILPPYIFSAIKQARLFNHSIPIYLIAEPQSILKSLKELDTYSVIPIYTCVLEKSPYHKRFIKKFKHQKHIFIYATERFFYLHEFLIQKNLFHAFHIENDTMIYLNLKKELPKFKKNYKNMAAIFDNDERSVPNFMYISHPHALDKLLPLLETFPEKGWYDMQTIGYFGQEFGEHVIGHLPIIMPEYHADHELISPQLNTVKQPELFYKYYSDFDSIFDGAAIGQYLGGIDPIHENAKPGFISESCIFNPSYFTYVWETDNKGRKIPYALYNGKKFKINNLHIHCKRLEDFSS